MRIGSEPGCGPGRAGCEHESGQGDGDWVLDAPENDTRRLEPGPLLGGRGGRGLTRALGVAWGEGRSTRRRVNLPNPIRRPAGGR